MELIVTSTMEVIVTCLKPLIYVTKKNSILDVVEFLDSSLITFVQDIKDSKDEYEWLMIKELSFKEFWSNLRFHPFHWSNHFQVPPDFFLLFYNTNEDWWNSQYGSQSGSLGYT